MKSIFSLILLAFISHSYGQVLINHYEFLMDITDVTSDGAESYLSGIGTNYKGLITKVDEDGDSLWSYESHYSHGLFLNEDTLISIGQEDVDSITAIWLSSNGQLIKHRTISPGRIGDSYYSKTGGFTILGQEILDFSNPFLLHANNSGDVLTKTQFDYWNIFLHELAPKKLIPASDSGFFLLTTSNECDPDTFFITKTSVAGDSLWTFKVSYPYRVNNLISSDNECLIIGDIGGNNLLKLDKYGNEIWSGDIAPNEKYALFKSSSGEFWGLRANFPLRDSTVLFITQFDSQFNQIWDTTMFLHGTYVIRDFTQNSMNEYLFAGIYDDNKPYTSGFLMKLQLPNSPTEAQSIKDFPFFTGLPNPFENFITFSIQSKNGFSYAIFSTEGALISKGQSSQSQITINTSDLEDGVYYVKISPVEGNTFCRKFIKASAK